MRLTVRTLLAYLDDRLAPENARDLGRKISASSFATQLIERIRRVKRSRSVSLEEAPRLADANLIADYLDDQLSPSEVTELEKRILASDSLLAEVAAIHEILGTLKGAAPPAQPLKQRLFALDPTGAELLQDVISDGRDQMPLEPQLPWQPVEPAGGSGRRTALVVCALLAGIWVVSLLTDSRLLPEADSAAELAALAETNSAAAAALPDGGDTAVAADLQKVLAMDQAVDDGEPAAAVVQGEMEPLVASAAGNSEPAVTEPSPAADADPRPVPPVVRPAYYLQAVNQFVMVRVPQRTHWTLLSQIPGGDAISEAPGIADCGDFLQDNWFGIPRALNLKLRSESGGWLMQASGGPIVRFPAAELTDLEVLQGHFLVSADTVGGAAAASGASLSLRLAGGVSRFNLADPQTKFAVQVIPLAVRGLRAGGASSPVAGSLLPDSAGQIAKESSALGKPDSGAANAGAENTADAAETSDTLAAEISEQLAIGSDLQIVLTVLTGAVQLQHGDGELRSVAAGQEHRWRLTAGGNAEDEVAGAAGPGELPDWMLQWDAGEVPERSRLYDQLRGLLVSDIDPVLQVQELLTDRNPDAGVIAVDVMELTGTADQLLEVLFAPGEELIHRSVIRSLRQRIEGAALQEQAVEASLSTRLAIVEVPFVLRLLRGLNSADSRDPEISAALIRMLGDDRLVVRTLAISEMERLTGERQNYFPGADAGRRRDAVRRWERLLDRQGGKLVP